MPNLVPVAGPASNPDAVFTLTPALIPTDVEMSIPNVTFESFTWLNQETGKVTSIKDTVLIVTDLERPLPVFAQGEGGRLDYSAVLRYEVQPIKFPVTWLCKQYTLKSEGGGWVTAFPPVEGEIGKEAYALLSQLQSRTSTLVASEVLKWINGRKLMRKSTQELYDVLEYDYDQRKQVVRTRPLFYYTLK